MMNEMSSQQHQSTPETALLSAKRTLQMERAGLAALDDALRGALGEAFSKAVKALAAVEGRVIVTGLGKSGHIARKAASTFASTGTPAVFVHPGEASHGDLGMITPGDIILAYSWSGETAELKAIVDYASRNDIHLLAITAERDSTLGRAASLVLELPRVEEACPNGLAPTTSTTLQLVLSDALALALIDQAGFTAKDFKAFHPGGKLGAMLTFVRNIMHQGAAVPLVDETMVMSEALVVMTEKSLGCLGVTGKTGLLSGIITDGDLRRHLKQNASFLDKPTAKVMTANPRTIPPDMLASKALQIMNEHQITSLFVTENGKPVGLVHIHALLQLGLS